MSSTFLAALVGCAGDPGATGSAGATGDSGVRGASALTRVVAEAAGAHCPTGGQAIEVGVDDNGNEALDDAEITDTAYVCNGSEGAAGATGSKGDQGDAGAKGDTGDAGAPGTPVVPKLGAFTTSQIVLGALVTCTSTTTSSSIVSCAGMKVDGLDARLGPTEANAICNAVTGAGYNSANGLSSVTTYLTYGAGGWAVATGNAAPMQNLYCNR